MNDLALDPSETRQSPKTVPRPAARRPWARIALFGVIGVAGTGAFAAAASTYLSGLAGPQRAKPIVTSRQAADWPDLKDGLPALATGSPSSIPKIREILPPEPAEPPVVEARIDPMLRAGSVATDAVPTPATPAITPNPPVAASKLATPAPAPKPVPALVEVPVIGPARQATLVAPARTVPGIAPLAAETVRAKTETATYAALPPEPPKAVATRPASAVDETAKIEAAKIEAAKPELAKREAAKPEPSKAKPRIEAHAKPPAATAAPAASKAVAEKPAARKPAAVEAKAVPAEAQDEDTEVFGIKVPSLAPAGRKLRESVEALGDAVKGIPDRF
ncbi:hypothetical protein [Methylobacterium sp. WL6]|uniref:hypothetical protein n=1 Tax=Methylobacterium sp. WL6 TaxID=2603901 RepID=UPI0011C719B3|nr:hypothetical protein [Methylobacterium sp. WL6]TXN73166.1 hypothetical protein FV230_02130 [Methylobacterium sp. WL6]